MNPEYEDGVEQFLQFASERGRPNEEGKYYCPCINCLNERRQLLDDIRDHLLCDGIKKNYTTWIWHGEVTDMRSGSQSEPFDVEMGDRLEDVICDLGQESFQQAHTPVYGWSDKSFTSLLEVVHNLLPEDNMLPKMCPRGNGPLQPIRTVLTTLSEKYDISKEKWAQFCQTREDPSWEKLLAEKTKKKLEEAAQSGSVDGVINPPSPIRHHVKWKMARTKKTGEMTTEAAKEIAEKIARFL
ncbi:hypothetical protein GmHk_03G006790 [Glycine max]|nr:hypothetical protein GmHk_03G006790 [Glycine max]